MELRELIIKANEAYYRDNNPTMPDYDYDQLIMRLRGECPDDPLLNRIGDDRKNGAKVRHPFLLLSLDNVYEKEGDDQMALELKLLQRFSSEPLLVVEPKVDGLTLMLCYEKGKLVSAATRGNGLEGEDVLETVRKYVNGIPGEISEEITVFIRGEVFISLDEDLPEGYTSYRNAASGLLRKKGADPNKNLLSFLAYDCWYRYQDGRIDSVMVDRRGNETFFHSEGIGYVPSFHWHSRVPSSTPFKHMMDCFRENYNLPMDGLVFKINDLYEASKCESTSHHPTHSYALKFIPESVETTITDITWQVGRTGVVTPVVWYDPVVLDGAECRKCTGFNPEQLAVRGIGPGAVVRVMKAGMVIPYIQEVKTKAELNLPSSCPECGTPLHFNGPMLHCPSQACPAKLHAALEYALGKNALDVKNIGPQYLKEFLDQARKEHEEDGLMMVSRMDYWFQIFEKVHLLTPRMRKCFDEAVPGFTLSKMIAALGIPSIGKEKARIIARRFNDLGAFIQLAGSVSLSEYSDLGEAAYKSLENYLKSSEFEYFKTLYYSALIPNVPGDLAQGDSLKGLTFVITGSFPKDRSYYVALIENEGGAVKNSVSARTSYLIAGEKVGKTKTEAARLKGVQVISLEQFMNLMQERKAQ